MNPLAVIGQFVLGLFEETGRLAIFTRDAVRHVVLPPIYFRLIFAQMVKIGYNSLPVVGLTAFFTGGVLALQIYIGGSRFNAENLVSSIVALGITRELGPVMAGLMVAGRVSAGLAAEIGTMRVTEQIDAMATLSTDPFKFLIAPRIIATTLMMPFMLVIVADTVGVMGGFLIATGKLDFNAGNYMTLTMDFLEAVDVYASLTKAAVFGFFISLMGCYHGYHSRGGAQGVGISTTNAVVSACMLILLSNYIVTEIFFAS